MNRVIDTQFWQFTNQHGWVVCERTPAASPCPRCGGLLYREPRRFIDRLLHFGHHRFQCASLNCGWEGHLAIDGALPRSESIS